MVILLLLMLMPRYQRLKDLLGRLVGSDLGVYRISPIKTISALKIVPPEPLSSWVPEGLEVILERVPDVVEQSGMYWSAVHRVEQWRVILTQYNRDEYNVLASVCDRILTEFGSRSRMVYQAQSEKAYERANIYIRLDRYLRASK
jgi:hypothetical protein